MKDTLEFMSPISDKVVLLIRKDNDDNFSFLSNAWISFDKPNEFQHNDTEPNWITEIEFAAMFPHSRAIDNIVNIMNDANDGYVYKLISPEDIYD